MRLAGLPCDISGEELGADSGGAVVRRNNEKREASDGLATFSTFTVGVSGAVLTSWMLGGRGGFSMPMSFMVALSRSRSLRSSSSSCVSSLRAPLMLPGLSVRGRRLGFTSGFLSLSPLTKEENARQSKDNERLLGRDGGELLGGGELNVVSFSTRGGGFESVRAYIVLRRFDF